VDSDKFLEKRKVKIEPNDEQLRICMDESLTDLVATISSLRDIILKTTTIKLKIFYF